MPVGDAELLGELVGERVSRRGLEHTATRIDLNDSESRVRPYYNRAPNAAPVDFDLATTPHTVTMKIANSYGYMVWKPLILTRDVLAVRKRSIVLYFFTNLSMFVFMSYTFL